MLDQRLVNVGIKNRQLWSKLTVGQMSYKCWPNVEAMSCRITLSQRWLSRQNYIGPMLEYRWKIMLPQGMVGNWDVASTAHAFPVGPHQKQNVVTAHGLKTQSWTKFEITGITRDHYYLRYKSIIILDLIDLAKLFCNFYTTF